MSDKTMEELAKELVTELVYQVIPLSANLGENHAREMTSRIICFAQSATAAQQREIERLRKAAENVFCPWCQTTYPKNGDGYKAVLEHLNTCLKHPIAERDSLRAQLRTEQERMLEVVRLCEEYQNSDIEGMDPERLQHASDDCIMAICKVASAGEGEKK